MNNNKLKQTHFRLTLLFTGVVFFLVLFIGTIFLWARYFHSAKQIENQFQNEVQNLSQKMRIQENFFETFEALERFGKGGVFRDIKEKRRMFPKTNTLSFIVFNRGDNRVIYKYLLQEPKFDEIDFEEKNFYRDEGYIIAVRDIGDNTAVFYKKIGIDVDDLLFDEWFLALLAVLFSWFFYLAGYFFIGRVLHPVGENMQDMQDFIHHAGHELKTPLAVIRGNLQIMQSEKEYDKKLLQGTIKEVDTTNNLIEWLREIAETGKLREKESYALAPEIARVVSELEVYAKTKQVSVENIAQGPLIVRANISELHMVLKNLIQNAIKYTEPSWKVELILTKNIFVVRDTGRGISSSEQEKIFERFYKWNTTRSEEGFGIGLALVKKIVDANGWKIELESEVWKGSEFRVIF